MSPDTPLTLKEASDKLLFGLVKVPTLRAAAERGELVVERLGRRIVTTPTYVSAWRASCRNVEKDRAFGSVLPAVTGPVTSSKAPSGSSETEAKAIALAAAQAKVERLKSGSSNTSLKSTPQCAVNVHYLKSS